MTQTQTQVVAVPAAARWWLWATGAVSYLGDGVRMSALPLLAVTLTTDPVQIGAVTAASWLPWLLTSLHAGVLVDRVDRPRLLRNVQIARVAVMLALTVLVLTGQASMPALYIAALLIGIGEVIADTTIQALVPVLVPDAELDTINGRLLTAETVGNEFAGPAAGGVLFGAARFLPFAVDTVSFAASALAAERLRRLLPDVRPAKATYNKVSADIAEGLRYLARHKVLRAMALWVMLLNLSFNAAQAMLILFSVEVLHIGSAGYGLLLGVGGVGGILAGLLSPLLTRRLGRAGVFFGSSVVAGVATLVIGFTSSFYLVLAMQLVAAFAGVSFTVIGRSLRQSLSPQALIGRVTAAYRLLGFGAIPLGALLGGWLAATYTIRVPFIVAGLLAITVTLVIGPWLASGAIERARATLED
jgi:MFS family permease